MESGVSLRRRLFLAWDRLTPSTSYHPASVRSILIRILSPIYAYVFRVVFSLQVFQQIPYMRFSSLPCVSYTPTIRSPFICLSWCCSVRYTNYEVAYRQITGREQNRGAAERSIMLAWLLVRVARVVCLLLHLRSPSGCRWYFWGKVRFGRSFVPFLAIGRRWVQTTYSRTAGKNHACSFCF